MLELWLVFLLMNNLCSYSFSFERNGCKQMTFRKKYTSIWPTMYQKFTAGGLTLPHKRKTCWHSTFCWDQWNGTSVVKILHLVFQSLSKRTNLPISVAVFLKWESLRILAGSSVEHCEVFRIWSIYNFGECFSIRIHCPHEKFISQR